MNDQEYAFTRARDGIQTSLNFIDAYLNKSQGQPTMSDKDVKLVLLHVKFALRDVRDLCELQRRNVRDEPKKFWQFWK